MTTLGTQLDAHLDNLDGRVAALEGAPDARPWEDAIEGRMAGVEARLSAFDATVADMTGTLAQAVAAVSTLHEQVAKLAEPPVVTDPQTPDIPPTQPPATGGRVYPNGQIRDLIAPVRAEPQWAAQSAAALGIEEWGTHLMASGGASPKRQLGQIPRLAAQTGRSILLSWQPLDNRPFDASLTTRVGVGAPNRRMPKDDPEAQRASFRAAMTPEHLDWVRTQGAHIAATLDVSPMVVLEASGHEINGVWNHHCPHAENVGLYQEMAMAHHDAVYDVLTPDQRSRCFWVMSFAKRTFRPGLTLPNMWDGYGDKISPITGAPYVDWLNVNVYFDVADPAWKDTPSGTVRPEHRQEFLDRVLGYPFGVKEIVAWAHAHGRPIGIGEFAPAFGLRDPENWSGDDPHLVRMFLDWLDGVANSGPGVAVVGPFFPKGNIGSRWETDLPKSWAALWDFLAA